MHGGEKAEGDFTPRSGAKSLVTVRSVQTPSRHADFSAREHQGSARKTQMLVHVIQS